MIQTPYKEYTVTWLKHYTHTNTHTCFRREDKARKPPRDDASCVLYMCSSIIFIILELLWFRTGNENILS